MSESAEPSDNKLASGVLSGNVGEPIKLTDLTLGGVSAEAARIGQTVKIWTRLSLTTDDRHFYRTVEGFAAHIEYKARQAGHYVSLTRHGLILLVIHPGNTGELWLDAAAVSLRILTRRPIEAGSVVFERDIADVTAMSFPLVEISKQDRVLCIFREGWRFALFFDFNPDGALSIESMERDLGTLHRRLKYRDLYDAIADQSERWSHLVRQLGGLAKVDPG
ncbi:MAG: hypothetical protein KKB37_06340 [Alphaproteobacteria bacterium]|nr:hypothetical protein [Alphaproteobacteria bacterium]